MVGGVSPAKAGTTHLGLPVFGSVKEVRKLCITSAVSAKMAPHSIVVHLHDHLPLLVFYLEIMCFALAAVNGGRC